MQIKPVNGHILIKEEKTGEVVSDSGFIIKAAGEIVLEKGVVLAVAPDVETVKPGQTVYYKDYELITIKDGQEEASFVKESAILGYE